MTKQNIHESNIRVGTATGSKGKSRVSEIIEMATQILVEDGYSEFTIRNIAAKANMKHGNLQYYFATKQDLITAILDEEFKRYQLTLKDRLSRGKYSNEQKFKLSIGYLLKDQEKQRSCVIFWEMWALSSHDSGAAKIMEEYYQIYLDGVKDLVVALRPEIKMQKAAKLSVLIVSMIEGLSLFRGYNKPSKSYLIGIESELRNAIIKLIS